jgi:diguanylate cyclase (GGDEF)-like protein
MQDGQGVLRRWGFALRLTMTLAGTLLAVVAVQQWLAERAVREGIGQAGVRHHAADARALEIAFRDADRGEAPMEEVAEVVRVLARRPNVEGAYLVDASLTVVAAGDEREVGERAGSPTIRRALAGTASAGAESEAGEHAGHVEFVAPVRLGGARHALEVDEADGALEAQMADLRHQSLVTGIGALGFGAALFFLLGGRALARRHRQALERATRDALTDLGNHRAFQRELAIAVAHAERTRSPLALALVDVDDFKFINDRQGHRQGDQLLAEVAGVLRRARAQDRAFRIGGDEFALLLPDCDGPQALAALERLRGLAASLPARVAFTTGVSVLRPEDPGSDAILWEQADAALYEGKRRGGACVALFADVADVVSMVTPAKIRAVRELLERPRLEIAFQPIWRLHADDVLGFEALARPAADFGFDGPGEAFAVAEKLGRAHELDRVCRDATLARAHELPAGALLFLNVHPQTLDHAALDGAALAEAVRAAGLDPERLVLEITERSSARLDHVVEQADRLRELGFKLALDDVGAGNAGLEMLRRTPVDFVKIDRSVVAAAPADPNARAVLLAIAAYATSTGAFLIAEGIETEELLAFVRRADRLQGARPLVIGGGQGYLLGRPAPHPRAPLPGA